MAATDLIGKYWLFAVVIILIACAAYPKYSGESSACGGTVGCNCLGYSYGKAAGLDAPNINYCMGLAHSCKKTSEGNSIYCP